MNKRERGVILRKLKEVKDFYTVIDLNNNFFLIQGANLRNVSLLVTNVVHWKKTTTKKLKQKAKAKENKQQINKSSSVCVCVSVTRFLLMSIILFFLTYSQLTNQITKSPASEGAGESKIIFTRVKCTELRTMEKRFSICSVCSAAPFWLLNGAYIIVAEIWQAICHKKTYVQKVGFL